MNIVGELVLVKSSLARMAERASTAPRLRETRVLAGAAPREPQRERQLDELQEGILEVRMVPLGQVFDKLARMVRQIAREAGKEIDLVITAARSSSTSSSSRSSPIR